MHLDKWPGSVSDKAGAPERRQMFVNYCLNCHGASYMRYKEPRAGLTEQQVKDNLMFHLPTRSVAMAVMLPDGGRAKQWFGATPPDLTIIAPALAISVRWAGADWLYTYLRFYRDEPSDRLEQRRFRERRHAPCPLRAAGTAGAEPRDPQAELAVPGPVASCPRKFDKAVSDLVGFMVWMESP